MATLKEYRRKRDFKKTPEPAGKVKPRHGQCAFAIQKPDATRLHYDFRLEIDGVLASWAVPKGPSLDPAEKHLAVHVEDHPLDYGGFEGIIPEGQYGGGTVMLWDRGTWEPVDGSPAEMVRKGRLKLRLNGEKLKGGWSLIRMAGRRGEGEGRENWLLIKERDEHARPAGKYDVCEALPLSVASGRSLEQIAAQADQAWESNRAQPSGNGHQAKPGPAARAGRTVKPGKKAAKTGRKAAPAKPRVEPSSLKGARKAAFPAEFKPQLATLVKEVPQGPGWVHEVKYDGYRMLAFARAGEVRLITRNGNDWTDHFKSLAEAAGALKIDAVLDGEVVALNEKGISDFQSLQNALKTGRGRLACFFFDLPWCAGYDLTGCTLLDRKAMLKSILETAPAEGPLFYSDHIEGQGQEVFEHACRMGMEGVICKRADGPYEAGRRGPSWVKVKCGRRQEFVIGGYSDPEGTRTAFGSLLLGYYDPQGQLVYCGKVGTGFDEASLKSLLRDLKKRARGSPAFLNPPRGRGLHWVEPELVGEVSFTEWTSDGILRHPSFQGLREDKMARQVVREIEKAVETTAPRKTPGRTRSSDEPGGLSSRPRPKAIPAGSRDRSTDQGMIATGGSSSPRSRAKAHPAAASVKATQPRPRSEAATARAARRPLSQASPQMQAPPGLSNPERVLWPEIGLTKLDLAGYYQQVAEWFLPHAAGRPLSLVRCPRGHGEKCFYQKHIKEAMPKGIHGVSINEKNGPEEYVAISGLEGLLALVQLGVLEIHPWGSREDDVERPDRMVFDLDPGPGVSWDQIIEAAVDIRRRLEEIGLESFLKTSGGKGLHIVVPVARKLDWDEFKAFTEAVALDVVRSDPRRYIANMSKAKRPGKIFVDYLRNGRGATSVAAYSTRARPQAPVSMPIEWNELTADLRPDSFNLRNAVAHIEHRKKDPWAAMGKLRQSITAKARSRFGM